MTDSIDGGTKRRWAGGGLSTDNLPRPDPMDEHTEEGREFSLGERDGRTDGRKGVAPLGEGVMRMFYSRGYQTGYRAGYTRAVEKEWTA